ncbi:MAG: ComF family protein [Methanoregulaceae archaeon]|nr:ComF family protein [Methanoregulaceae archaeon]
MDWLAIFYPTKCALCARSGEAVICERCAAEMEPLPDEPSLTEGPLTRRVAYLDYTGRAAQAVRRLKYDRVTSHAALMSRQMAELAERTGVDQVDAVVPVPIHWSRRCLRGFNQAELLAEAFPEVQLGLLRRIRPTRPQVGLSTDERLNNLQGAFLADDRVKDQSILLLDDVTTSGGTALECARTLLERGAREVSLITYATGG